jgi:hypothetical protein
MQNELGKIVLIVLLSIWCIVSTFVTYTCWYFPLMGVMAFDSPQAGAEAVVIFLLICTTYLMFPITGILSFWGILYLLGVK